LEELYSLEFRVEPGDLESPETVALWLVRKGFWQFEQGRKRWNEENPSPALVFVVTLCTGKYGPELTLWLEPEKVAKDLVEHTGHLGFGPVPYDEAATFLLEFKGEPLSLERGEFPADLAFSDMLPPAKYIGDALELLEHLENPNPQTMKDQGFLLYDKGGGGLYWYSPPGYPDMVFAFGNEARALSWYMSVTGFSLHTKDGGGQYYTSPDGYPEATFDVKDVVDALAWYRAEMAKLAPAKGEGADGEGV
jgi:hypothetical protein